MARTPKEGQRGLVKEQVAGSTAYAYEVGTYHDGWWWVDGIAVTAEDWRPLTLKERFTRWLARNK